MDTPLESRLVDFEAFYFDFPVVTYTATLLLFLVIWAFIAPKLKKAIKSLNLF